MTSAAPAVCNAAPTFTASSAVSNASPAFTAAASTSAATAQMTAPASMAPAATSSATATASKISAGTPASAPFRFKPVSALAKHVVSRFGGAACFSATVITTGPVLSASTTPAAPVTITTSAVTTGMLSSPAPENPVFTGFGGATGFASTVTTTTPASPALTLCSSQAATPAGSTLSTTATTLEQEPELAVLKVAYPDFWDFNRNRSEGCFAADQIWAIYDYLDLMPRGYARINNVYSPFKVDLTWLEFVAGDIDENAWKRSGLPVACGKFKLGTPATTENIRAFSHKSFWESSVDKSYTIYPRKGETWALYKNWNINWSSDPANHREYQYEFVVVLSDYTYNKSGISVARLVKLKGFGCLFKPVKTNGMASFQIPTNEILRFSHRVPSFRTNGKERKDVPEGCFELDTCSLPSNLEDESGSIDMEAQTVDCNINGSLKSVSKEKHPMPKKRKNPDAESTLDGSSAGGNISFRMSTGCYENSNEEKRAAASGRPLHKSKATNVSDISKKNVAAHVKEMSPDGVNAIPGCVDEDIPSSSSSSKFLVMPDTEFCNVDKERSGDASSLFGSTASTGGGSLIGSISAAPAVSNAAPTFSILSAVTKAVPAFTAAATASTTITASPGFSTSNLLETPSAVASTTSAATTQTTAPAPALVAPAATSSSTTNSSTFSVGTPSSSSFRFEPVSSATTIAVSTGPLSSPAPAKSVVSGFVGGTGFASKVTTTDPVLSASTTPATPATTTSAVTTGLLSSPAPIKPVFSGCRGATGFASTGLTTTPASPALGLFYSHAATFAGSTPSTTTPEQESERVVLKVVYPDFYDFNRNKSEECFAVNQRWAVFDCFDRMPRNYVRIDKVYSPFKVDVTWLEFIAGDKNETAWKGSGLPVACGKFKHGKADTIEDIRTFSHKISWGKCVNKSYNLYPRKGETWALYKNWNIQWSSDPDNHRDYEYEFVVVLSDYTYNKSGISVARLVKLKGFVCLFKPIKKNGMASFQIPPNEILRFSHRVPSFRMNGKERNDIPAGYFELDPCSLPSNLEDVSGGINMEAETVDCNVNGSLKSVSKEKHPMLKKRKNPDGANTLDRSSPGRIKSSRMSNRCYKNLNKEMQVAEASGRPLDKSKANIVSVDKVNAAAHLKEMSPDGVITISGSLGKDILSSPASLKIFEMLDTEFCNSDQERSCQKFKTGQIWALYCKLDKLPKNYAQIVSVESFPDLKLAVKWLESCDPPRSIIPWVDKEMPVSCGTFKVTSSEVVFSDSISFSHQLSEVPAVNNVYTIYPRAGEVWAVYSKFRFDLSCSDLKKCEYNIVEILEVVDVHWIIVSVLKRVTGSKTVFKAKKEGFDSIAAVPWIELYRFSHQVPSFMLSGARYGKLHGCWELDPRSLTVY